MSDQMSGSDPTRGLATVGVDVMVDDAFDARFAYGIARLLHAGQAGSSRRSGMKNETRNPTASRPARTR